MSARLLLPATPPSPTPKTKKRKRATNACLRCRLKKQRCDGISQPCANCAKSSSECTFPDDAAGEKFLRQHIANLEAQVIQLKYALTEVEPNHPVIENFDISSKQDLVNGFGFLTLTSGAEPLYLGGSSGAPWGRIFSSALSNRTGESHFFTGSLIPPQTYPRSSSPMDSPERKLSSSHESATFSEIDSSSIHSRIPIHLNPGFIFPPLPKDKTLSDEIFSIVCATIQPRHCFMNFASLRKWHNDREKYCASEKSLQTDGPRTVTFFLWLTYALGLRLLEMRGRFIPDLPSHEHYFQAALQCFDLVSSNTTTIQALLFLAMYSFRSEKGLSAWHLSGLAMRSALELGLHRKLPTAHQLDAFNEEMRKRIWWSVYCLDRTIAFQLGRPIAIQDDEIDNELPLDIDCHITDHDQIVARRMAIDKKLSELGATLEDSPYPLGWSSMSPSLHHIRLRKILTKIKEKIYRPRFAGENTETRCADVDSLLWELDHWRANIPTKKTGNRTTNHSPQPSLQTRNETQTQEGEWSTAGTPFYTGEWFELQYHNAVQNLLIPCALTTPAGSAYLRRAAHAAMAACQLQRKRLQEDSVAPLSVYSLHKLFMSGIFMLFALDKDPGLAITMEGKRMSYDYTHQDATEKFDYFSHQDSIPLHGLPPSVPCAIKKCQESLSIYALHYPQAKPYAQCFEAMSKAWLRKTENRENRVSLSQNTFQNSGPKKASNNHPMENKPDPPSLKQSFDSANSPTLWRDELNPPGRFRPSSEPINWLELGLNSLHPSEPSRYDLLSLGKVEKDCDLGELLQSESERYQSQRPWLLGRINMESMNSKLEDILEPINQTFSQNLPSGTNEPGTPHGTDSEVGFSSGRYLSNDMPTGISDNRASISNFPFNNAQAKDQNLRRSSASFGPRPPERLQNFLVAGSHKPNPEIANNLTEDENSTFQGSERVNVRKFSSQDCLPENVPSSCDPRIHSREKILKGIQATPSNFSENQHTESGCNEAIWPSVFCGPSDKGKGQSSNDSWLGWMLESFGNADQSMAGGQIPQVSSVEPNQINSETNAVSFNPPIAEENQVQEVLSVSSNERATSNSFSQQNLRNLIFHLLNQ